MCKLPRWFSTSYEDVCSAIFSAVSFARCFVPAPGKSATDCFAVQRQEIAHGSYGFFYANRVKKTRTKNRSKYLIFCEIFLGRGSI